MTDYPTLQKKNSFKNEVDKSITLNFKIFKINMADYPTFKKAILKMRSINRFLQISKFSK